MPEQFNCPAVRVLLLWFALEFIFVQKNMLPRKKELRPKLVNNTIPMGNIIRDIF
jgi:hypothetical protein